MAGVNRFSASAALGILAKSYSLADVLARRATITSPCVFISHQFRDLAEAVRIGNELRRLDVDVWLDADSPAVQQAARDGDDRKLADLIELGLANCSHLLALISPNTRGSWWVPYEIGSCRGRNKDLAFFVHQGVPDLPAYLIFGEQILDDNDFYAWASRLSSNRSLAEGISLLIKSGAQPRALSGLLARQRVGTVRGSVNSLSFS